mmetsp:Transcript_7663/g.31114  ORF Transcript_7663/g.31114 Transcript_7663/m.31114 type:complete len:264 (-) Transcript_7663:1743-2534(-)
MAAAFACGLHTCAAASSMTCRAIAYSVPVKGGTITGDARAGADIHIAASAPAPASPAFAGSSSAAMSHSQRSQLSRETASGASTLWRSRMRHSASPSSANASCRWAARCCCGDRSAPPCSRIAQRTKVPRGRLLSGATLAHVEGSSLPPSPSLSSACVDSQPVHSPFRHEAATKSLRLNTSSAAPGLALPLSTRSFRAAAAVAAPSTRASVSPSILLHSRCSPAALCASTRTPSRHIAITSADTKAREGPSLVADVKVTSSAM